MLREYLEWFGAAVLAFVCSSLLGICEGPHPDAGSIVFRYIIQAFGEDVQLKVVAVDPIDSSPQVHVDFDAQCFALFACCKFMACSGLAYAQSGQHFHSFMATLFG
jgi:hypothetical protein